MSAARTAPQNRQLRAWALRTMRNALRQEKRALKEARTWADVARQCRAVAEVLKG